MSYHWPVAGNNEYFFTKLFKQKKPLMIRCNHQICSNKEKNHWKGVQNLRKLLIIERMTIAQLNFAVLAYFKDQVYKWQFKDYSAVDIFFFENKKKCFCVIFLSFPFFYKIEQTKFVVEWFGFNFFYFHLHYFIYDRVKSHFLH
jgi:hypothetical protein